MIATVSRSGEEPPWAAADLNSVTVKEADGRGPVALVEDGRRAGGIVFTSKPGRLLSRAVKELQSAVEEATGAKLPVLRAVTHQPALVIGDGPDAARAGLRGRDLPPEGFAIKTAGNKVLLVGNGAGAAFGVYEFIERFTGARWYFPGPAGRFVPKMKTLAVPPVWIEDAPVFRKRQIWPDCSDSWSGGGTRLGPLHEALRRGSSWPIGLRVHQPNWANNQDYRKNRPEVYQKTANGKRDLNMICYGNPRTLETYLAEIEAHYDRGQRKSFISGTAITVSPWDAEIACYCKDCRRLWDDKGGQYGTASKILTTFVARLGREVEKRWPGKRIIYLPYLNYTLAPSGIRLPDNIEIQLCGMPGLAMYKEPSIAKSEQANIDAWYRMSGRKIQNWHYSCWPEDRTKAVYNYPHVVKKFYQDNRDRIVGTFINGVTDHWPRQHLSLYCWLKVLWDPDFDVDAATDAYCQNMYGPASGTMRKLVEIQIDGWEKSRWAGAKLSSKNIYKESYPKETIEEMENLLTKARKEARGRPTILRRLDYFATPFADFFEEYTNFVEKKYTVLDVQKVGENPRIDGRLDDRVWGRAQPVSFIRGWDKQQKKPTWPTTLRAVWTGAGVTLGFRMTEPTPHLLAKDREGRDHSTIWWDDNVEIILDPSGKNEGDFYHFIVTVGNEIMDAHGGDASWTVKGLKSAVYIGADFWSLEVFLPYNAFPKASRPGSGTNTIWHGNFTRHRVCDKKTREYQRLNTTYAGPSTNLSSFSPIRFAE